MLPPSATYREASASTAFRPSAVASSACNSFSLSWRVFGGVMQVSSGNRNERERPAAKRLRRVRRLPDFVRGRMDPSRPAAWEEGQPWPTADSAAGVQGRGVHLN